MSPLKEMQENDPSNYKFNKDPESGSGLQKYFIWHTIFRN